jgi:O-antigen/teichoic acid export membrane protein
MLAKVKSLVSGKQSRANVKNAAWSSGGHVLNMLAVFLLTPLIIRQLGLELYGIFTIVSTVIGFSSILSLGLGQATLYYVVKFRAEEEHDQVNSVIETTVFMYGCMSLPVCLLVFFGADVLVDWVFRVSQVHADAAKSAFRLSAFGFFAFFLNSVADSGLKAYERFDYSTLTTFFTRLSTLLAQVGLLFLGYGLEALVLALVVGTAINGIWKYAILKSKLAIGLSWIPLFSGKLLRLVLGYGIFSWANSILSALRTQGDILLVGALVGPAMLPFYSVPIKVMSQVFFLLNRTFEFLFPYIGKLHTQGKTKEMSDVYEKATYVLALMSVLAIAPLAVLAYPIMELWLGEESSYMMAFLMQIMSLRFVVYPLSIVNSRFLQGTAKVKQQSIIKALNCLVILSSIGVLGYYYGIVGAALGQMAVFVNLIANRCYVEKALFGSIQLYRVVMPVAAAAVSVMAALLLLPSIVIVDYSEIAWATAGALIIGSLVCILVLLLGRFLSGMTSRLALN